MGRPPCCDKSNVKRGLWTAEEDAKILAYISTHGTGNWTSVPIKAGLKRCGKSCRLRWTNYLRPDLKHESFTPQEEDLIITLHATIGSRWSIIAAQLPGRTDNDVKNYWNTKLRKKLYEMGIDPVTHKPISQILADYGKMGLPTHYHKPNSAATHYQTARLIKNGSLNRHFKKKNSNFTSSSDSSSQQNLVRDVVSAPHDHEDDPNITIGAIHDHHQMISLNHTNMAGNDNIFCNNNPTLDLLAQLQAIQLVAEAQKNTSSGWFYRGERSSATTPPPPLVTAEEAINDQTITSTTPSASSPSFSWREFLLDDDEEFLPDTYNKEEDTLSSQVHSYSLASSSSSSTGGHIPKCSTSAVVADQSAGHHSTHIHPPTMELGGHYEYSGDSSGASFVDAILDRDREMLWVFPDIVDI
ncbi:hypothetical protein H6P81_010327 [Aristolochia fimbriata]|uniref:Uncharacterized protein n=1 Tax=Aristolochia fimbriata TaxID=158543 RepID=A0AAV7ERT0_ARIFI|nr:hypothetical protein H6P81_010327 [Aristolochia fimbriata]